MRAYPKNFHDFLYPQGSVSYHCCAVEKRFSFFVKNSHGCFLSNKIFVSYCIIPFLTASKEICAGLVKCMSEKQIIFFLLGSNVFIFLFLRQ